MKNWEKQGPVQSFHYSSAQLLISPNITGKGIHNGERYSYASIEIAPTVNKTPRVGITVIKGDVSPLHSHSWQEIYFTVKEGKIFLNLSLDPGNL